MSNLLKQASKTLSRDVSNWKPLLESSALEVFEMMAGVRLTPSAESGEPSGELMAMVGMAGALCGMTTIRCSYEAAGKLASMMLGGDAADDSTTTRDALGELCNMVTGNFKTKVSTLGDHCHLSVPTVITGEDYSIQAVEPVNSITVALALDDELIWVSLVAHE